jgi:hypothetical protein
MMSTLCNKIFQDVIYDYHLHNNIDHPISNPYHSQTIEHLLYLKCWIDTVQWHMEDVVKICCCCTGTACKNQLRKSCLGNRQVIYPGA